MQLQQIRYFVAVCKCRTFTGAAHQCGVSQPSLTQAIKRLELELGGRLFERGGRKVTLTALGRHINRNVRAIILAAERVTQRAREFTARRSTAISTKESSHAETNVLSGRIAGPRWNGNNGSRGARQGRRVGSIYDRHPGD
jgi:DNA-binding transcriptional LysR family regulator